MQFFVKFEGKRVGGGDRREEGNLKLEIEIKTATDQTAIYQKLVYGWIVREEESLQIFRKLNLIKVELFFFQFFLVSGGFKNLGKNKTQIQFFFLAAST